MFIEPDVRRRLDQRYLRQRAVLQVLKVLIDGRQILRELIDDRPAVSELVDVTQRQQAGGAGATGLIRMNVNLPSDAVVLQQLKNSLVGKLSAVGAIERPGMAVRSGSKQVHAVHL